MDGKMSNKEIRGQKSKNLKQSITGKFRGDAEKGPDAMGWSTYNLYTN